MQRKFLPAINIAMLFLLTVLLGCNGNHQDGPRDNGNLSFDTARAARSVIPINTAATFQKSFIGTRNDLQKLIRDTGFLAKNFNLPNGEAFTKDAILLLLSQKEADGIRLYYGKDSKGVVRLVLLPIRKDGSVIYNKLINRTRTDADSSLNKVNSEAEAVETGQTCPPCLIEQ